MTQKLMALKFPTKKIILNTLVLSNSTRNLKFKRPISSILNMRLHDFLLNISQVALTLTGYSHLGLNILWIIYSTFILFLARFEEIKNDIYRNICQASILLKIKIFLFLV
jgi:hypothetical protein